VIGCGALTHLRFAAAYALVAVALVLATPATGALVGALYGGAKGTVMLAIWSADHYLGQRPAVLSLDGSSTWVKRGLSVLAAATVLSALVLA
jgi:hypothetical protein